MCACVYVPCHQLLFTEAVVRESLRLMPPGAVASRSTDQHGYQLTDQVSRAAGVGGTAGQGLTSCQANATDMHARCCQQLLVCHSLCGKQCCSSMGLWRALNRACVCCVNTPHPFGTGGACSGWTVMLLRRG